MKLILLFVIAAWPGLSWGAVLNSSDGAFSIDMPGAWTVSGTGPGDVLSVKKGGARIKITKLPRLLSEEEVLEKNREDMRALTAKKKARMITGVRNLFQTQGQSGAFIVFRMKGRKYKTGYFTLGAGSYSFLLRDLTLQEESLFGTSLAEFVTQSVGTQPDQWAGTGNGAMEFPVPGGYTNMTGDPGSAGTGIILHLTGPHNEVMTISSLSDDFELPPDPQRKKIVKDAVEAQKKLFESQGARCTVEPVLTKKLANGLEIVGTELACDIILPNFNVKDLAGEPPGSLKKFSTIFFNDGRNWYLFSGFGVPIAIAGELLDKGRLTAGPGDPSKAQLGAPPVDMLPGDGAVLQELAPLPERRRSKVMWILALAVAGILGFGYWQFSRKSELQPEAVPGDASVPPQGDVPPGMDPVFQKNKFLLKQKHFSISEKYRVWDEAGQEILFIERPRHIARNALAILAALATGAAGGVLLYYVVTNLPQAVRGWSLIVLIPAYVAAVVYVWFRIHPKRHVAFYGAEENGELLLVVVQDQKWAPITLTYTVCLPDGKALGSLKKNHLYNVLRRRWYIHRPDGTLWATAKEDSIFLSILRRFLGSLWGLLRTNFVIFREDTREVLGNFNRKFTILDRYVLDMTPDRAYELDRRVAIALGVMLDTGERR